MREIRLYKEALASDIFFAEFLDKERMLYQEERETVGTEDNNKPEGSGVEGLSTQMSAFWISRSRYFPIWVLALTWVVSRLCIQTSL